MMAMEAAGIRHCQTCWSSPVMMSTISASSIGTSAASPISISKSSIVLRCLEAENIVDGMDEGIIIGRFLL